MPQDELWGARARTTGLIMRWDTPLHRNSDRGLLTIAPTWAKRPSGRNGFIAQEVEDYIAYDLAEVFKVGWETWLYDDAKHVPACVSAKLTSLRQDFRTGVRG